MPDTTTTVLGLVKPEVGASTDLWGPKLNTNFDDIDALFDTGSYLKVANGGTGAGTASGARTNLGLGTLATLSTVTATQISSDAVTTAKILDANVTAAKLATNAVETAKIADGNVTAVKLASNAVETAKILDSAVTTAKIANSNVTLAKLAADVLAFLIPVGSINPYVGTSAPTGWLLCSGATIGSGSSGATARANADTQTLYELLWNAMGNTELPIQDSSGVASTRGASAAADFAANKRLPLPDLRGRVIAGQDDMGGSSANRLTGLSGGVNGDTMGAAGGAESHTLLTAEMPAHTHTFTYGTDDVNGGGASFPSFNNLTGQTETTASTGGDGAHNNVQPTMILNYIIKY
jgi:microcystin-dependent protein